MYSKARKFIVSEPKTALDDVRPAILVLPLTPMILGIATVVGVVLNVLV